MSSVRRPLVALGTTAVLVVVEAIADPTGLLALVGWPGGHLEALWWQWAPYVVFVPVLLAVVWWSAVRAGARFWTMAAGATLAVLLAQAATCLAMTGNPIVAGWASGYVTAKAIPAALIVAAVTRLAGGRRTEARSPRVFPGTVWPAAVLFGAIAPLLSGLWWTGAAYTPLIPAPRSDRGAVTMLLGVAVLVVCSGLAMRWMRRRVPGMLGVWLGAVVAGGMLGLVQAVVGVFVDNGFAGDLWPLMAAYVQVADGLAFGVCVGWIPAVLAVAVDAVLARRSAVQRGIAAGRVVWTTAVVAVIALVVGLAMPGVADATAQVARESRNGGQASTSGATTGPDGTGVAIPSAFLRSDGSRIVDGHGDTVLLRGVNVNQLVDFYRPRANVPATRPLTENDFAQIAAYGFDVVRLNLSWSSLEPQRGVFSQSYLARIRQAVRWAGEHDLRVVLDMHQDAWSNEPTQPGTTCRPGTDPTWGYDGAPAWATLTDDTPRCQFTGRDISPAGDRAFQNFWFDTDGVQKQLVDTWGRIAKVFRDDPTVAGYDLINEPGFGETAPVTTSYLLGQYSSRAIDAIRAAGAPQIVFVEPSILWSGLGFDSGPEPGFTSDRNIVFSPHLSAESITMDYSLGLPTIISMKRQFTLAERVAQQYDAPLWSGEYGYWGSDDSVDSRMAAYAGLEDANALGSAYWVWKQACGDPQNGITDVSSSLVREDCSTGADVPGDAVLLGTLSRAYPRAVPGTIIHLVAEGAKLRMTGDAGGAGARCGMDVWLPGTTRPQVTTTGVTRADLVRRPGGWELTGCASGRYAVDAD